MPDWAADLVADLYRRMPETRITDILLEVDDATRFTEAFTHLRTGESCRDRIGLPNVLLAEGINLGSRKMAEATTTHRAGARPTTNATSTTWPRRVAGDAHRLRHRGFSTIDLLLDPPRPQLSAAQEIASTGLTQVVAAVLPAAPVRGAILFTVEHQPRE